VDELTLSGHLELHPAFRLVLLRARGVAQAVILVIGIKEVIDDGAGLPQLEARLGIFNRWHAAVGVDGLEGIFLQVALRSASVGSLLEGSVVF